MSQKTSESNLDARPVFIKRWATRVGQRLRPKPDATISAAMDTLRTIPAFSDFTWFDYFDLARSMHFRAYKKGDYVYHEDDPGLGLYVIQSGCVRLIIESPDQPPHEISELGQGDIFGIPSLIGNHRRTETARAFAETRLLGFFRPDLNRFLREFPKVGGKLFLAISRHITAMQISQVTAAQTDAEKILALKILHCVNDTSEFRNDPDHGA